MRVRVRGRASGSWKMTWFAPLLAAVVVLGAPAAALANGRYPTARFMTFGPGDSSPVIGLQTTFGYVFSSDAGKTWQLRCEEAIGFDSTEVWDPPLVLTGTRAIAGLPLGLSVAGTSYCGFDRAASVPEEPIVDLASDTEGQKIVVALGPIGAPNGVMLSDDGGTTFRKGWSLADFLILTVDFAPTRTQRLYASGIVNGNIGALFRSDDGGATFVEASRAFGPQAFVFISAVDPQNPDVLYVRVDLPTGTVLSRSDDGGATFRELKRTPNRMTGFAISRDGKTLWIGSPGDLPDNGVFRSTDLGATWQPMSGGHTVLCLRHHDGILYMCTPPEMNGGIALACSSNGGESFNPVLTWADLAGPESCPTGSPGRDLCDPSWAELRSRLIPDGGLPPLGPRGCTAAPASTTDAASPPPPDAAPPTPHPATPPLATPPPHPPTPASPPPPPTPPTAAPAPSPPPAPPRRPPSSSPSSPRRSQVCANPPLVATAAAATDDPSGTSPRPRGEVGRVFAPGEGTVAKRCGAPPPPSILPRPDSAARLHLQPQLVAERDRTAVDHVRLVPPRANGFDPAAVHLRIRAGQDANVGNLPRSRRTDPKYPPDDVSRHVQLRWQPRLVRRLTHVDRQTGAFSRYLHRHRLHRRRLHRRSHRRSHRPTSRPGARGTASEAQEREEQPTSKRHD